jgi:hypothetical protein
MTLGRTSLLAIAFSIAATPFGPTRFAHGQAPQHEVSRTVPRDTESRVNVHFNWNNQGATCVANGIPTLTMIEPPKNGTARFGPAQATPSGCPNSVDGVGVFYRPNPGFLGQDRLVYEKAPQGRVANSGNEGANVVIITVH